MLELGPRDGCRDHNFRAAWTTWRGRLGGVRTRAGNGLPDLSMSTSHFPLKVQLKVDLLQEVFLDCTFPHYSFFPPDSYSILSQLLLFF